MFRGTNKTEITPQIEIFLNRNITYSRLSLDVALKILLFLVLCKGCNKNASSFQKAPRVFSLERCFGNIFQPKLFQPRAPTHWHSEKLPNFYGDAVRMREHAAQLMFIPHGKQQHFSRLLWGFAATPIQTDRKWEWENAFIRFVNNKQNDFEIRKVQTRVCLVPIVC